MSQTLAASLSFDPLPAGGYPIAPLVRAATGPERPRPIEAQLDVGEERQVRGVERGILIAGDEPSVELADRCHELDGMRAVALSDRRAGCRERSPRRRQARLSGGRPGMGQRQTQLGGRTSGVQRGEASDRLGTDSAPVEQVGGRWPGRRTSVMSPRWVRIFRMTTGSSMVVTGGRVTTPPPTAAGRT